jgi:hypothetical protein
MQPSKHPAGIAITMMMDMVVITPSLWTNDTYHDGTNNATPKYRETEKMSEELNKPAGPDGPKVQYAAGKIAELLLELHEKDRPHVLEGLNKLGVLGSGVSKYEKDRDKDREAQVKASEEHVAQVKKDLETPIKKPEPEPKGAKK